MTNTGFENVDIFPFVDGDDDKIEAARIRDAQKDAALAAYNRARDAGKAFNSEADASAEAAAAWAELVAATPQVEGDWATASSRAQEETILLLERKRRPGFGGEIPTLKEALAVVTAAAATAATEAANAGGYGGAARYRQSVAGPELMLRLIKAEAWEAGRAEREAKWAAEEAAEDEARRVAHEAWEAKRAAAAAAAPARRKDDLPF
jgi:hypothetical protein